jgi:hypothetical protein
MFHFGLHPKSAAVGLLAAAAFLVPLATLQVARAQQQHPEMSNVIPDGGTGSIEGKVLALDHATRAMTIASRAGTPVDLYAGPAVRVDNVEQGDEVEANYTRQVLWVVTPTSAPAPAGATSTVGQVAHTPGGIGPEATQISARVTKIDPGRSFDIVDATGGGMYTIVVTDPTKAAMMANLQVGNAITVSLTPMTITSMEKCGWFGCS